MWIEMLLAAAIAFLLVCLGLLALIAYWARKGK